MIIVNKIPLDYNDSTPVSFNVGFMDLRSIGSLSVEGIVSITLSLPRTQRNHLALGHYSPLTSRVNAFDYEYTPYGNIAIKGRLRVVERSREQIKVLLTAGASDWIDLIKSLNAQDIDLGYRQFNIQDYLAVLEDQSELMYPFFKLFESQFASLPLVHINNFKPAPNLGNFIRKAFAKIGFAVDYKGRMSILDKLHLLKGTPTDADVRFNNCVTLLDAENGVGSAYSNYWFTNGLSTNALIPITTAQIVTDPGLNVTLEDYTHLQAAPPNGNSTTSQYPVFTNELDLYLTVTLDLRFRVNTVPPEYANDPYPIVVQVVKTPFPGNDILVPPAANPTEYEIYTQTTIYYTGHIGNALFPIPVNIVKEIPSFQITQGESFMIAYYVETPVLEVGTFFYQGYKQKITVEPTSTSVRDSMFYFLNKAMPDVKVADVLKAIAQNFNVITDTKDGIVEFYNRDEWYLDDFDDWSEKTDTNFPIEHEPIQGISKILNFQYAQDEDDKLQTEYRNRTGAEYGSREIEFSSELLYGEELATSSIFYSASMQSENEAIVIPSGYQFDEEMDSPFFNNFQMEDRILYNSGNKGYNLELKSDIDDNVDITEYMDGDFEQLTFPNLYPKFWERTIEFLEAGEFVRVNLRLTPSDIEQINYRKGKLIRLDDGNIVKGWINKIEDLRPGSDNSTRVEFIVRNNPGTQTKLAITDPKAYDGSFGSGYD